MAGIHASVFSSFYNSIPNSISRWILDTGATDYIICAQSVPVTNSFVSFPNGHRAQVAAVGLVQFNSRLTLFNVLFIPSFKFNLLYVHKLVSSKKICFIFMANE